MAKKVRFPLEMENGIEVRDIASLKDNFSLPRVIDYLKTGKLAIWLRDHYCEELAERIEKIDIDDVELANKICAVFGIEYNSSLQQDMEKASEREKRKERLREYSDNQEFFEKIDDVAFDQDELYDLLDEETQTIYLCGERFFVPVGKKNITYVGINDTEIIVDSDEPIDFTSNGIIFNNTHFNDRYAELIKKSITNNEINNTKDGIMPTGGYIVEDTTGRYSTRRLFKDTEPKEQIPIPNEESVMDYCYSDDYIYIITQVYEEYVDGKIKDTKNAKLYKVDRVSESIELLRDGFNYGVREDLKYDSDSPQSPLRDTSIVHLDDDNDKVHYMRSRSRNMVCNDKYVAISKYDDGSNINHCDSFVYCSEINKIIELPRASLICLFNDNLFMKDYSNTRISGSYNELIRYNLLTNDLKRINSWVEKVFYSNKSNYMIYKMRDRQADKYKYILLELKSQKSKELLSSEDTLYFDKAYMKDGKLILRRDEIRFNENMDKNEIIYYELVTVSPGEKNVSKNDLRKRLTYYLPNGDKITKDDASNLLFGGISFFKKK